MNKEVYYEGWLIKSPPTKRIWRARWRRRWFTLKQGEIPEQFCLEYYADRKCRKLKGVIDLDQCEQVDCGLRLENRKQKFQFMFDIKTPKRIYYLAADTETDMRDWVNCICQVCHLHDTKQEHTTATTITNDAISQQPITKDPSVTGKLQQQYNTSNVSSDTTTTSINSSTGSTLRQSPLNDIVRPLTNAATNQVSHSSSNLLVLQQRQNNNQNNNNDSIAYVNTEYTNRETLLCDVYLTKQQPQNRSANPTANVPNANQTSTLYLNAATLQHHYHHQQQKSLDTLTKKSSSTSSPLNTVIRKIPENLVLNNSTSPTGLRDTQYEKQLVQSSPAPSTASGPYIPISECFSGSPKFMIEGGGNGSNDPTTPLNNLDPKFYDTPRSHNNIGLNLTNDQSYSPKITNCGIQQPMSVPKNQSSQRSDSDSESVFTDDEEWTHPMPLRENQDRHPRPSDSSVENESFVLTYSQRFSKLAEDIVIGNKDSGTCISSTQSETPTTKELADRLAKVLKNKNNLILDFKQNEKLLRDLPQFSDTENTSPAILIGPQDANSVVDESYDIPRSHQLPYYNMSHLLEQRVQGNDALNPIAASTPNLVATRLDGGNTKASGSNAIATPTATTTQANINKDVMNFSASVRTLPRAHCYTNAAPTKIEGNVFRYDFVEQADLPPVNRNLKPKFVTEIDKLIDDLNGKLQQSVNTNTDTDAALNAKLQYSQVQNNLSGTHHNITEILQTTGGKTLLRPPSVDRKNKPSAYKIGNCNTLGNNGRRSPELNANHTTTTNDNDLAKNSSSFLMMESKTLPRQLRGTHLKTNNNNQSSHGVAQLPLSGTIANNSMFPNVGRHQRTTSAISAFSSPLTNINSIHAASPAINPEAVTAAGVGAAGIINTIIPATPLQNSTALTNLLPSNNSLMVTKNEHKLQYFDLDVANAPPVNRQSISVGNLNVSMAPVGGSGGAGGGGCVGVDALSRSPMQSSVVYNSVDFVKTEAFKRIREERKKENEGVSSNGK